MISQQHQVLFSITWRFVLDASYNTSCHTSARPVLQYSDRYDQFEIYHKIPDQGNMLPVNSNI
uniref:Uncharacterized protein n=1 Tax=Romanomermis culicivorax TaxID=13658 RepID=A0A915HSD9_ROMCU